MNFYQIMRRRHVEKVRDLYSEEIAKTFNSKFTFDKVPIRKLLIANIPPETTHKELKKVFSDYGKIENCILKKRQEHGKSYAFVTYSCVKDSVKARNAGESRGISIKGQYLRVLPANSWNQPESISYRKEIDESPKELCDNDELEKVFDSKCTIDDEEAAIHKLNDDCLLHIFMYLSVYDRVKIERVCKRWKDVSMELWRSFKDLDFSHSKLWGLECRDYECSYSTDKKFKVPFLYHILRRSGDFITNVDFSTLNDHRSHTNTASMIAKLCPNVQSINYEGVTVDAAVIKALAHNCINIKILQIKELRIIETNRLLIDKTLSRLFARNKSLQCIKLNYLYKYDIYSNNLHVPMKCLYSLPYKSVNEIDLEGILDESIPDISKSIQKLQFLRALKLKFFTYCGIYSTALKTSIGTVAASLTVLEISNFHCSRNVIPVGELRNLKEMNVSRSEFVNDEWLMTLSASCKLLTNLNISGCFGVTNLGLSSVASLPKLLHLNVSGLDYITDEEFGNMTTLATLNCSRCKMVGDEGLIKLIAMANDLESLNIVQCSLDPIGFSKVAAELTKHRINDKILTITVDYGIGEFFIDNLMVSQFLKICSVYENCY